MPRPKPKKKFQPGFYPTPEKFTKIQEREMLNVLGLDPKSDKTAYTLALDSIAHALGIFRAAQQQDQTIPTPAAIAIELQPILRLCRKLQSEISGLSWNATKEIEGAIMYSLGRFDRDMTREDSASMENVQRILREVPDDLSSLERHLKLAFENNKAPESRAAPPKKAFGCLIRSLEDIFDRYAQGDDNTPEARLDFIGYILKSRKIPRPKKRESLHSYLRSN